MDAHQPLRLLSIGEFAAATQLSPKALRLYDEQRLLRPAAVDAANGYRYYRADQVALGRLIRTLRDMDLPLAAVADIVAAQGTRAETLLLQFAQEGDRRFARQRRAFQTALALLHRAAPAEMPAIAERARSILIVAVRPFLAQRGILVERFRAEVAAGYAALTASGLSPAGEPFCVLVDPIADDEGRLEAAIPIAAPTEMPHGITIRQMPAITCAAMTVEFRDTDAPDLTAALDALFDWFDRRGHRAIEPPAVSFLTRGTRHCAEVLWAYEPVSAPSHVTR